MSCLILAVCLAALGTAFVSELFGGLRPCILCIYQRYAYGVAMIFGLIGVAVGGSPRAGATFVTLAGLAFLAGAAIAAFHVGVEQHWWRGTAECHAPVFDSSLSLDELREQMLATDFVPCDEVAWSMFGISMAGYNALFSFALALLCFYVASATRKLKAT